MRIKLFILLLISTFNLFAQHFPIPKYNISPKQYGCFQTSGELVIDGKLDEKDWEKCSWSESFVDIEGDLKEKPFYNTRMKMLFDQNYLYIGAYMEDRDLWATLTERDAVIFHDNDFEVFIDPDGDTHDYYELEINALNTVWDLFVIKPYRDRNQVAINAWDIKGLKTAVHLEGTLNDNRDVDQGWSVEIAIPWKVLEEAAHKACPPKEGDIWRMNFSRVHYLLTKDGNSYKKASHPEYNWVWSPQGLIAMHYPEQWGYVIFSEQKVSPADTITVSGKLNEEQPKINIGAMITQSQKDLDRKVLRYIYYAQKEHYLSNGAFAKTLSALDIQYPFQEKKYDIQMYISPHTYEIILKNKKTGDIFYLFQDGRIIDKIDF